MKNNKILYTSILVLTLCYTCIALTYQDSYEMINPYDYIKTDNSPVQPPSA